MGAVRADRCGLSDDVVIAEFVPGHDVIPGRSIAIERFQQLSTVTFGANASLNLAGFRERVSDLFWVMNSAFAQLAEASAAAITVGPSSVTCVVSYYRGIVLSRPARNLGTLHNMVHRIDCTVQPGSGSAA